MVEKIYNYADSETKLIEKIMEDENVGINHMILANGDALPEHYSNSHVYMFVIKGTVSLKLDDQDEHNYPVRSIINIPFKTKMNVYNKFEDVLELFVVKSPSPKTMPKI